MGVPVKEALADIGMDYRKSFIQLECGFKEIFYKVNRILMYKPECIKVGGMDHYASSKIGYPQHLLDCFNITWYQ